MAQGTGSALLPRVRCAAGAQARDVYERLALEAGLVVGACALVLVLGSTLDRLGLVTGPLAWVTALALLALAGFPIVHIFDRFHCRPCDREFRYGEVRSRGWSLR